jgi:hypothetical protein
MRAAASATDRAVRDAVHLAVTIEFATVAAVTSTGVTLTMPDGGSVPGIPVLHPYVPRVGDEVRVAVQGGALLVLGGVKPDPRPTTVTYFGAGPYSYTSNTFGSLSTPARVAFVAPPSGAVILHTKVSLTPTAAARAYVAGRILTNALAVVTTSTTLVEAPAGGGTLAAGAAIRFSALTPGTSYYAETVAASGVNGTAVTVAGVYMIVQPEA